MDNKNEEDLRQLLETDEEFKTMYFSVLDKTSESLDLVIKARTADVLADILDGMEITDSVKIVDLTVKLMEYQKEEYPKIETMLDIMSKSLYGFSVSEIVGAYQDLVKTMNSVLNELKDSSEDEKNV